MKNKILTISVAAYNAEAFLKKCLDSMVLSDVADELDIIVVDDGSKDGTALIAGKYEVEYPGIVRLITKENGGHGSTINTSIRNARGKYFKIVDSDDWVDEEGIVALVKNLRDCEADLVINPYYREFIGQERKSELVLIDISPKDLGKVLSLDTIKHEDLAMHAITFKKNVVTAMGSVIDEKCFYVDLEYILFAMQYVQSLIVFNEPVYHYLLGSENQSVSKENLIKRRDEHLRVLKRLVEFYSENREQIPLVNRTMILRRIHVMLRSHYQIFLWMDSRDALKEIKGFDKWLKRQEKEIYKNTRLKLVDIMNYNRWTNYMFYNAIRNFVKDI